MGAAPFDHGSGPDARGELAAAAYDQLREMAARMLKGERAGHTLQPTALVHEAYLRLEKQGSLGGMERTEFLALAALTVRHVLVDHARRRHAAKRQGQLRRVELTDQALVTDHAGVDTLELDEALTRLEAFDPRKAQVVQLRFFGGLTVTEVARVIDLSERAVAKEWARRGPGCGAAGRTDTSGFQSAPLSAALKGTVRMDESTRWTLIDDLFKEAIDLPAAGRDEFLRDRCAGDDELAGEVRSLLDQHEAVTPFLDAPALGEGFAVSSEQAMSDESPPPLPLGQRLGQYELVRVIGTGGMSVVYEARQREPARAVAIKVLRLGTAASRSVLRRFHDEARILARLRHEGIAQVYEFGVHTGPGSEGRAVGAALPVPYLAMEFVPEACTLTEYSAAANLGVRDRVELLIGVCAAVHHGHQRGIIHRDLKPSNILVDGAGRTKVIDFGVARITDSDVAAATQRTSAGELVGTLQYMSPEQCDADPSELDVRTDVYSLGVVLYQLLTGRLPYEVPPSRVYEAARVIKEEPTRRPSQLDRSLRGDLETIMLGALAKQRADRYQSAAELADDLRRYLDQRPIRARPPSAAHRVSLLVRRNPATSAVSVLLVAALIAGVAAVTAAGLVARRQRDKAEAASGFLEEMLAAPNVTREGPNVKVSDVLDDAAGRLETRFAGQPEVQASLRTSLARAYDALGLYERARPLYEQALEQKRSLYGRDDPRVASAMVDLGVARWSAAEYGRAEELLRGALEVQRRRLGPRHADVGRTVNDLGVLSIDLARLDESERLLREALEIRTAALGRESREVAQTLHNLGGMLMTAGRPGEAEAPLRESTAIHTRVLGPDHYELPNVKRTLALVLADLNRLDEAEQIAREAVADARRIMGPSHPDNVLTLCALARVCRQRGDLTCARQLFAESLEIYTRALGPAHPETRNIRRLLVEVLRQSGQDQEADAVEREGPGE